MQSPAAELGLWAGHAAALNVLRNAGEPDGDTISETLRRLFRVDTPAGRLVFRCSLVIAGTCLERHIVKRAV